MRTSKRTRFLSALMALLMVFSLLPASALAADVTSTWEPVALADITASDTVAITMSKDGATWALPTAKSTTQPGAAAVTAADGKLTIAGAGNAFGWTITAVDGGYQISAAGGQLYINDANSGVRVGTPETDSDAVFTLKNGYLTAAPQGTERWVGVYANNPDWRCYKPNDDGSAHNNIAGQTLGFWKLVSEETSEPGEEPPADPVKLSLLEGAPANGDVVYLAHPSSSSVLTATASGKKLAGVTAEKDGDDLILSETMAALTVSVKEGVYTFSADGKFLTSGKTGSALSFAEDGESDLAKWTLEQKDDGTWVLMNKGANYNGNYNQALEYYSGFTTYGVKDTDAYKFAFYANVAKDPVSGLKTGDTVAIFNDAGSKAVTATVSGNKLAGADAALGEDGKLSGEGIALFTVTVNEDGTVTFENDGKFLTSGATGSSLTLEAEANDYSLWVIEDAGDGLFFLKNANAVYNGGAQYLEYYNAFTTYGKKATAAPGPYAMSFRQLAEETQPAEPTGDDYGLAGKLADGDVVILYNAASGMALGNTLASHKITGVAVTPKDGVITTDNTAVAWTVTANADGTYTFKQGDLTLGGVVSGTYNNLVVTGATYTSWTLTGPDASDFNYFLRLDDMANSHGKTYLEYYNGYTLYGSSDPDKAAFGITFYKQGAEPETPGGEQPADAPLKAGDRIVIYNAAAQGSIGLDNSGLGASLGKIHTDIRENTAYPNNGAYVFTVGVEGDSYTFSTGGKYLATCNTEQLFLADEKLDTGDSCAYWQLEQKSDGYLIKSKTARYNGNGVVCIEFYSDAFSGWTYKSSDPSIFLFNFYPVHSTISTLDDVTNNPQILFYSFEDPVKGEEYKVTFTLDDLTPLDQLAVTATLNGENVTNLQSDGKNYSFIVPAEVTEVESALNVSVQVTNAAGGSYLGAMTYEVKDVPVFENFQPAPGSKTGEETMPLISAEAKNVSDTDQATITIGGVTYPAKIQNGVVSYQPTEPLKEGRVSVKVEVKRADGVTGEQTWSFTVGEGGQRLYFGQLHSHTTYSDGSGTLDAALEYVKNLPESANVQFVAFTDHSNYFDTTGAANPEGALYDMSLASESSQTLWNAYRGSVAEFNASQSEIVALAGFEMTWSGGPGHINTFNSPGIVSRNNATLNQKTNDAGMKAYYALLDREEGRNTISQFNHPGKTFGNFTDFSYWDALTDSRMFMVEVGNGEGQIGAGGYYPSYEQYIMALDKGWHVAPTNNQDNHKGRWGNANDARDVILTDDFSEEGIYDALRAMRMYATEDKNLEVYYTVNDELLGSTISEIPEQLELNVQVSDPDSSDRISKVEVVVNSGKVIHTWDDAAAISSGTLTVTLAPNYSYYFIRVTEADGDLAVTAPVWVGETLKLGISAFESGTAMPVTGEELTLTTTLYNSEASEATVKNITYTTNGSKVLGVDTNSYKVPASGTVEIPFQYTPDTAKVMTITATVVMVQDGKEFTFTKDLTLDVQNAEDLVYIGIDASHHNEYVAGNYKDSMGNFAQLAAGYAVRTVYLKTSDELISACGNEKYKILVLTAPSRRDGSNLRNPYENYTDAEIAAITAFNAAGGTVVLTGWSDYYEHYAEFPAADHMAAQQNKVLAALGSSLRIADDGTNDDVLNGGQTPRLYFSTYNLDNPLLAGVEVDPEHPNDRAFSEVFSHYGGASIYAVDASGSPVSALPDTVSPAVYGHASTYSWDSDSDGLGGASVPKYPVAEGDSRLLVMATEQLPDKGLIVVSGAAFLSNFEVQAAVSSGSSDADTQKNYSNYKVCENLVRPLNELKVSSIADVRAVTEDGFKFTIEGVVTSNASGYDKDTAFFDCIYVQDESAGICCFPVSGSFKVGDKVRVTGTTDFYQGEPELQVTSISLLSENNAVAPVEVTAKDITSREAEGKLITLKGTVESFELANGLVQTITVKDAKGDVARVFIDGYITTGNEVKDLAKGCEITVTGLASYDDTFNAPDGPFPRIRVRDRADVICVPKADCDGGDNCPSKAFTDVDRRPDSWSHAPIDWAVVNEITQGTAKDKFSPNAGCTREQVVTFLWRAAGKPAPTKTDNPFKDVTEKDYSYEAILWAVEKGITVGTAADKFSPKATCTREQIVTFLWRYEGEPLVDVANPPFKDVTRSDYSFSAVLWAVDSGVTVGTSADKFSPKDTCTRAQVVTFLYRDLAK